MFLFINGERINVNSIVKYSSIDKNNKFIVRFLYNSTFYTDKIFLKEEERNEYIKKLDENFLLKDL